MAPIKKQQIPTKNEKTNQFSFEISLSVLNHLGRNLYRSFITVLGEAISNSWDADAKNVWIYINSSKNFLVIKDDGLGMDANDFQNKFLKIGYSKRNESNAQSPAGRPFIGRKGIGKLALLSCAEKVTIISKAKGGQYVGGTIDNSELDKAITNNLSPQEYPLANWKAGMFNKYAADHVRGTIIVFENIKQGIKNSLPILQKIIALYFRFSLLDASFNIYVNNEKISYRHLRDLALKTEFLWNINDMDDPYIKNLTNLKERRNLKADNKKIQGFIASVNKPRDLSIINMDERVSVDLFVNGRLREKDILKHIPTARIVEDYLYGQIHFNELDEDGKDRFTSGREGIVSDDTKFQIFLTALKKSIKEIIEDWDKWRIKHREDGDFENNKIPPKERKAEELFNVVSKEYIPRNKSANKDKINTWVDSLVDDAKYNLSSYAECFISENLIRKYIENIGVSISSEAKAEIGKWLKRERESKEKGNISIEIRKTQSHLSYLSMDALANLVDKRDHNTNASLSRDATEYKPIRDALAHTALLTDEAKRKLSSVYENIKGRLKGLLYK